MRDWKIGKYVVKCFFFLIFIFNPQSSGYFLDPICIVLRNFHQ